MPGRRRFSVLRHVRHVRDAGEGGGHRFTCRIARRRLSLAAVSSSSSSRMRRWAWLASAARASRSAASWRLAAWRLATLAISSARSGPSISAPSWRRSRARSLSRSSRSQADLVAGDGEAGAQAGLAYRLAATWQGRGAGAGLAIGPAALGGFEVLADAGGVDQPGRHSRGGGDCGRGDRCPGGFQVPDGGEGALALVVAGFGAGGQHGLGAGGGGHAVSVAREVMSVSGRVRTARARRRIRLASSTSARWPGSSWDSLRRIASATAVNASISAARFAST